MQIEIGSVFQLASGRRVMVADIRDGMITYTIDGVRSLAPLRKTMTEFMRMLNG